MVDQKRILFVLKKQKDIMSQMILCLNNYLPSCRQVLAGQFLEWCHKDKKSEISQRES